MLVTDRSKQELVLFSSRLLSYQPLKEGWIIAFPGSLKLWHKDYFKLQTLRTVNGHKLHAAVFRSIGIRLCV